MSDAVSKFVLPGAVITKSDLSRLVSELELIDNELTATKIRAKEGITTHTPILSENLDEFLTQNKLTLNDSRGRTALIKQLRVLKDKAPIIHMTFAVSADRESLYELAEWLRKEVHPQTLISVGLQPALVAGVSIRTPNHVHDFSLRSALDGHHELLIKELEALRG